MLGTQHAALDLQGLAEKRLGLGILALKQGSTSKAAHGFEGLRILCPQHPALQIQRPLQLLARLRVEPRSLYVCPMVSRMAASTSGCRSNFPAIRAAARSNAVRTFRSGSGLVLGPDWLAALA